MAHGRAAAASPRRGAALTVEGRGLQRGPRRAVDDFDGAARGHGQDGVERRVVAQAAQPVGVAAQAAVPQQQPLAGARPGRRRPRSGPSGSRRGAGGRRRRHVAGRRRRRPQHKRPGAAQWQARPPPVTIRVRWEGERESASVSGKWRNRAGCGTERGSESGRREGAIARHREWRAGRNWGAGLGRARCLRRARASRAPPGRSRARAGPHRLTAAAAPPPAGGRRPRLVPSPLRRAVSSLGKRSARATLLGARSSRAGRTVRELPGESAGRREREGASGWEVPLRAPLSRQRPPVSGLRKRPVLCRPSGGRPPVPAWRRSRRYEGVGALRPSAPRDSATALPRAGTTLSKDSN